MQTWLADPVDGGWSGSQQADRDYYAGTLEERQARTPPNVDGVLYAAWNAQMVSATLRAAELLDDTALGEFALKSLERINVACYSPGAGVAHCLDGRPSVRGLLDDQIAMAAAHLDAHTATGNIVYEMMAQELAHYAVRMMWDEQHGGFFDRSVPEAAERIGLMRDRLKPFVGQLRRRPRSQAPGRRQRRSQFRRAGRSHPCRHGPPGRPTGPPGRALCARPAPAHRLM